MIERKIDLCKEDAVKYLKIRFREENEKGFDEGSRIMALVNNKGKVTILCKYCEFVDLGHFNNIYGDVRFDGNVIETGSRHSVLRLRFVDRTKRNINIAKYLFCPLFSILFILLWYDIFFENKMYFAFAALTVSTITAFILLAHFALNPKIHKYEMNLVSEFQKAVESMMI